MHKSLLALAATLLATLPVGALAQIPQVPQNGFNRPRPPLPGFGDGQPAPELKRFTLNFAGGTPSELVAAISQALAQPLNAIIPEDQKQTKIMPIKVADVTVPELFQAIETASTAERAVVNSMGGNGMANISYRTMSMGFRANTAPATDKTVWSFYSTAVAPEYLATLPVAPPICRYYQLAPYLEGHTIEDITTAIQTGWQLLKVNPLPQLSFHAETKLLIAVGQAQEIEQIPQVLEQLNLDNTAAVQAIAKLKLQREEAQKNRTPESTLAIAEIDQKIRAIVAQQQAREELKPSQTARSKR